MATLEISINNSGFHLIQARCMFNSRLDEETKGVVINWANENNIKVDNNTLC